MRPVESRARNATLGHPTFAQEDTSSRAKRQSELRERAEKASEKDGIQHNGECDTVGECLDKKERAREAVGLDPIPNSE